jgi:glutathione S-transferase
MRLSIRPIAPNALKVLIFTAERGIHVETVDVGEMSPEEYGRVSALHTVPVLETDSGLSITESLTICQYLMQSLPARPCSATGSRNGPWWRYGSGGRS